MAYQIGHDVISRYDRREDAERVIECLLPAGFIYEIHEQRLALRSLFFQIVAYDRNHHEVVGYCNHGDE